jgi:CRP/FNR family transcriptional regulator
MAAAVDDALKSVALFRSLSPEDRARLAEVSLVKLAGKMGRPGGEGINIPMALSRQDLADLTGTTIETCIRVMSRWGKEGLVRTEKDGFVILDRRALERMAAS